MFVAVFFCSGQHQTIPIMQLWLLLPVLRRGLSSVMGAWTLDRGFVALRIAEGIGATSII